MADTTLRGTLEISIDKQGLTATGIFTADPDADEITVADVVRLLSERGIRKGTSKEKIDKQLQSLLPDPPEHAELVLASGIPPKKQQAETVSFDVDPVPENLIAHVERILNNAGPPQIFKTRTERVQVEKVVEKKAAFPFGQAKQEKILSSETRTIKEKVYIDPTVTGSGYIYTGEKAGDLFAGEEGISGYNLFDEEIPPAQHGDPHFYLGEGLELRGSEIFALHDGLIRWGEHWAEVIEFVPHSFTLTLSPDKASCLLNFFPGESSVPLPDEDELRDQIAGLGYPEELLIEFDEIYRLMRQSVQTQRAIENIPLSVSRDSSFEITVSEDKLTALLQAHKGRGKGKPLRLKEIGVAIKQSKLAGLDLAKIKEDLLEFYISHESDLTGYVLAKGTPPEEGTERELTYSIQVLDDKEMDAVLEQLRDYPESIEGIDSIPIFPMTDVQEMAPVELEQRIITMSPPEPGEPGKDVYGKILPGLPGQPTALELHENLAEKGNVIIATEKGILDKGVIDGITHLRVRAHKDSEVLVEISPDGMQAVISMFGSVGSGRPLRKDAVYEAINNAGVVRGINEQLIEELVEKAQAGEQVQSVSFARGRQAVPGGKVKIDFAVQLASGKGVRLRQDGTADYRNQDNMTQVHKDELIAVMLPPAIASEDGYDVTGRVLSAPRNADQQIEISANIRQEERPDGTIRLFAEIEGELVFEKNSLDIRSNHSVNGDISMETGNIRFPGSVQIKGNVRSGFYVISGGDVMIGGAVEAALVSAEGEIKIMQGIKGSKKAVIRTKKGIQTMFAEHATMLSVEDILVKNSIMHCKTKTNGRFKLHSDKSTIMGGVSCARHGMQSQNIGSPRGIKTVISFGQDYLIGDKIEQEQKEIDKIKKAIAHIDLSMQSPEARENQKILESLRRKKVLALKAMEKRGLRLFALRERFEEHYESEIRVKGSVFPGVIIESHGRTLEITHERKNVSFRFDPHAGHITEHSNTEET